MDGTRRTKRAWTDMMSRAGGGLTLIMVRMVMITSKTLLFAIHHLAREEVARGVVVHVLNRVPIIKKTIRPASIFLLKNL
jgi:hypothetical protein